MIHSLGASSTTTTRDGRRLHLMSAGEGPVTVVFESGLGFSRSTWGLVAPAVAGHARAVVYDRAGLGRSEVRGFPRTLARIAADLGDLLTSLGPGPFVLVGHSWGGPIVRSAAAADRSRVRGLVLVDQSDENCELYFGRAARRQFAAAEFLTPVMARTGLYRRRFGRVGAGQPTDVFADHWAEDFTRTAAGTAAAEVREFLPGLRGLRAEPLDLGELPVTLISGTQEPKRKGFIRRDLAAAHRASADALPGGRHVEAPGSEHLVMLTDPQIVVEEVLRLL